MSKLEHLLLDREFIIHTDHVNLTFLKESKNARVNRWKLALQEYKYTIEFIKGSDNVIADSLSRLCVLHETTPPLTEGQILHAFDEEDIDQLNVLTSKSTFYPLECSLTPRKILFSLKYLEVILDLGFCSGLGQNDKQNGWMANI